MKRKLLYAVPALLALVGIVSIWVHRHPAGLRVYQGKAMIDWVRQTGSPDPTLREQSATFFKSMDAAAVPELRALLRTSETPWRRLAWSVGVKLPMALRRPLLTRLGPPRAATIQSGAARSLAIIGPAARSAVPDLERALRGRDTQVACEAARALGFIGKESVPPLVEALRTNYDRWVRSAAASALGQLGPKAEAAIPALMELLSEPDQQIQPFAVTSLSSIGPAARPALLEAIQNAKGLKRRGAAKALEGFTSSRRLVIPPLLDMLKDPDPATRQQAAETINAVVFAREPAVLAALENATHDPNAEVRAEAEKALRKWNR